MNATQQATLPTARGFVLGPPGHILPRTLRIDAGSARRMRCQACRHRGMDFQAMHKGTAYAAVARCGVCQHEVEL
jgi:hypothetical protein